MDRHSLTRFPVTAFVILAGAIGAVLLHVNASPFQNSAGSSFALPANQQFTNSGRQLVSISPDGTLMVYVANTQLFINRIGEKGVRPIPGTLATQGISNPVFSPDGQSVAYWSAVDQTFKRIPIEGGTPVTLFRGPNPFGMSWSSEGRIFTGAGPAGILSASQSGGPVETVVTVQPNQGAQGPQLLPGGDALMFTLATAPVNWDNAKIVVQSLKTREQKTLVQGGHDARYLPSGHIVFVRGSNLMIVPFDIQRLEVTGTPVAVQENVETAGNGSSHFSLSSSGALVFISPSDLELASVALDGSAKPLTTVPADIFALRLSPDGKQVVYDRQGNDPSIWICDLATGAKRQFTGAGTHFPLWTVDGTHILYISDSANSQSLWWRKADGSEPAEKLVDPARAPESWAAAGQLLSFITLKNDAGVDYDIWTYSLRDKKAQPLIENPGTVQHSSRFSPDGKWLAYVSNETGTYEVYVQPYPTNGDKYKITNGGGLHPLWSPDGSQLYFDKDDKLFSVPVRTTPSFSTGSALPMPVEGFQGGGVNSRRRYDMTADGTHFLMLFQRPQIQTVPAWFSTIRGRIKQN